MKRVLFRLYQHKNPRLRADFVLHLSEVPMVGDFLFLKGELFSQVDLKIENRDTFMHIGAEFVVVKRRFSIDDPFTDWMLDIEPAEPFKLKKDNHGH